MKKYYYGLNARVNLDYYNWDAEKLFDALDRLFLFVEHFRIDSCNQHCVGITIKGVQFYINRDNNIESVIFT